MFKREESDIPLDNPPEADVFSDDQDKDDKEQEGTSSMPIKPPTSSADFYAILNVPKNASVDDIKASFKRLSLIFHPDRQSSSENTSSGTSDGSTEANREIFMKIQRAYEVLANDSTRAIYDLYGEEGVDSMATAVGQALKTPAELRAEYERVKLLEKKQRMRQEMFNAMGTGDMQVALDYSELFSGESFDGIEPAGLSELLVPQFKSLQIVQSSSIMLSEGQEVDLGGYIMSKDGKGAGYASLTHKFALRDGRVLESSVALGSYTATSFKLTSPLFKNTCLGTASLSFRHFPWVAPPVVELSLSRMLSHRTRGTISIKSGEWVFDPKTGIYSEDDCVELALNYGKGRSSLSTSVQAGTSSSGVSLAYNYKLSKSSLLKTSVEVSNTSGASVTFGASRTVLKAHNRIGISSKFGLDGTVKLTLKFTRYSQSLSLPVYLSDKVWDLNAVIAAVAIPAVSIYAFDALFVKGYVKRRSEHKQKEILQKNKEEILMKKKEATEAIQLMRKMAEKKVEEEMKIDSLVIIRAYYGQITQEGLNLLGSNNYDATDSEFIADVKIPLLMLVKEGKLHVPGDSNKFNMIGFYDPCPWLPNKRLYVEYTYKGVKHEAVFSDMEPVNLPMRSHQSSTKARYQQL
ncbi:hypothetical protein MP638_000004 [Amoeboaphelidium occidentale]|nr:hypothetical protein MP638_000004 [Amoeboaphelidium occidentale]